MKATRRLSVVLCAAGVVTAGLGATSGCASGRGGESGFRFGRKGAPWTILCMELAGPNRLQHVEQFAQTLKHTPGIRSGDVSVRNASDGYARLYYGTYYRRIDRKTGKRNMPAQMRRDLGMLKELGDASGQHYFLRAIPVRMPTPDVGDPEWNLSNVDASYSLQVAVFEPTDEFWEYKRAAAELCAFLRRKGYEAYYHHSDASSVVTVGAFGPEAVIVKGPMKTYYSAEVRALQRDELLKYNLLNGAIYKIRNSQGEAVPVPSRLVQIPRRTDTGPG